MLVISSLSCLTTNEPYMFLSVFLWRFSMAEAHNRHLTINIFATFDRHSSCDASSPSASLVIAARIFITNFLRRQPDFNVSLNGYWC